VTPVIHLRDVVDDDVAVFYEHQRDPVAARMAAFGTRDPDVDQLAARLKKSLAEGSTTQKAIVEDGRVVGLVATFVHQGKLQVTYWIARSHWGRGIASAALSELLRSVTARPIYASAAGDNFASLRVLEKCGFVVYGAEKSFANARDEEVEEVFLELR
jgi:RimJ/RimL family protein N-acetyltransferase